MAQAIGVSTMTLVHAEDHVAAVAKYSALGSPDASQTQALALAQTPDALPDGEGVTLLAVVQTMGLPWGKLAEAIPRVAGMPAPVRQELYRPPRRRE